MGTVKPIGSKAVRRGYWSTRDGRLIQIKDMHDGHLVNSIAMLMYSAEQKRLALIDIYKDETTVFGHGFDDFDGLSWRWLKARLPHRRLIDMDCIDVIKISKLRRKFRELCRELRHRQARERLRHIANQSTPWITASPHIPKELIQSILSFSPSELASLWKRSAK